MSSVTLGEIEVLGGITVPQTLPAYSGVRIKGNEALSDDVSRDKLALSYGGAADGSDGGAFVEFYETGGRNLPHVKAFGNFSDPFQLIDHWAKTRPRMNQFQMSFFATESFATVFSGVAQYNRDAVRDNLGDGMAVTIIGYMDVHPILGTPYRTRTIDSEESIMAHEFGHLLGRGGDNHIDSDNRKGNHVDAWVNLLEPEKGGPPVLNYTGQGLCLMSYDDNETIGKIRSFKFDVDCLYGIRDKENY